MPQRLLLTIILSCSQLACGGCSGDGAANSGRDSGQPDGGLHDGGDGSNLTPDADAADDGADAGRDFGAGTPGEPWVDVTPTGRAPVGSRYPEMVFDEAREQVVLVTEGQTWVWDTEVWVHVADGPLPGNRERFAMAYDRARQEVVLFGGWTQGTLELYGDTWVWDGASWSERAPTNSPAPTFDHEMAWDAASQRVILYGGGGQAGLPLYEDTWAWDGDDWVLVDSAAGTGPRNALDMVFDSTRNVAVLYGSDGPGVAGIWEFDGAVWARADDGLAGPSLRNGPALLFDPTRDATLLVSGYTGAEYLTDTWSWDGTAWVDITSEVGELYRGRFDHAASFDGAVGEPILFGGYGLPEVIGTTLFDETHILRDGTWRDVSPDASPPAMLGNGMAYDPVRREVVLYGGTAAAGGRAYRSTWTWDGRFWRRRDADSLPGQRYLPGMAFDSAREVVVLYGGGVASADQETYTWDGETWEVAATDGPTGPGFRRMVWDEAREQIVLHTTGSTWTWDGSEWRMASEEPIAGLAGAAAMVYDPARPAPVLIGTVLMQDGEFDTAAWTWGGAAWERVEDSASPMEARNFSAAFWDAARDSIVVFGGSSERSELLGDTVELAGDIWRDLTPVVSPTERNQHGVAYDASRRRGVLFGGQGTTGRTWEWNGAAARVRD